MSEPRITTLAAHMSGYQTTIIRIVLHDEESPEVQGSALANARYFANPASGGSAHYITDADTEEHCVPDTRVAWHAPPNTGSIGIEQSGFSRQTRTEWLDDYSRSNIARTAARTAELCIRHGVPPVFLTASDVLAGKRGITGHVMVSQAFRMSDHSDPGIAFPWDLFIPLVRAAIALIANPEATKTFQASAGLVADGDAGRLTVLALGARMRPVLDRLVDGKPTPQPTPTPKPTPIPVNTNRFAGQPTIQKGVGLVGAASAAVRLLQDALNKVAGTSLTVDGRFGEGTDLAIRNLQRFFRMTVDGIVGPKTWALLDYLLDLKHL